MNFSTSHSVREGENFDNATIITLYAAKCLFTHQASPASSKFTINCNITLAEVLFDDDVPA